METGKSGGRIGGFSVRNKLVYAVYALLAASFFWLEQESNAGLSLAVLAFGLLAGWVLVGRGYFANIRTDAIHQWHISSRLEAVSAGIALLGAVFAGVFSGLAKRPAAEIATAAAVCLAPVLSAALGQMPLRGLRKGAFLLGLQGVVLADEKALLPASRAGLILADQSLFFGRRSAELKSFYFAGKRHRMTSLHFKDHLPLVIAMRFADDGSLSRACGLKEGMGDTLLCTIRMSAEESRLLSGFRIKNRREYNEELGFAAAEYWEEGGRALSCAVGRPDALLPLCESVCTEWGSARPITMQDERRLKVLLRQAVESGQQTFALAAGIPERRDMTLIGLVFAEASPEGEAFAAVSELERAGVPTMLVSDDLEGSALYKAGAAGFSTEISHVINGTRLERLAREENFRALRQVRLAAEMRPEQRKLLSALTSADKPVIAASKNPDDGIFASAHVRLSEEKEGLYPPNAWTRSCRMPALLALVRLGRRTARALRKISLWQWSIQLGTGLALLILSPFAGEIAAPSPLTPQTALLLLLVMPLPTLLAMGPSPEGAFSHRSKGFGVLQDRPKIQPLPGKGMTVAAALGAVAVAVGGALVFDSLAGTDSLAPSAGMGLWFTLFFGFLALALPLQAWGETLFREESYGTRGFLFAVLGTAVFFLLFWNIPGTAKLMGLGALPVRHFPKTLLPALLLLALYEIGRIGLAGAGRK